MTDCFQVEGNYSVISLDIGQPSDTSKGKLGPQSMSKDNVGKITCWVSQIHANSKGFENGHLLSTAKVFTISTAN